MDDIVAILLARMADPLRGATDALLAKEASIVAEELRMKEGASGTEVLMPALLPPGHLHARAYAVLRDSQRRCRWPTCALSPRATTAPNG